MYVFIQINGASEDAPLTFVLYLGVYIMNESCVMAMIPMFVSLWF